MSLTQPSSTVPKVKEQSATPKRKRRLGMLLFALLVIALIIGWQLLSSRTGSTDPTVAGRPLSNPKTHLHIVALGGRPGVIYLGTHYGLFTSTNDGHTWPQPRGALNTHMITSIAISPLNPSIIAVVALSTGGLGEPSGVYFSRDGGSTWQLAVPSGLPLSAYPFTVQAGSANEGHFYVSYAYIGWFETRDMGAHWYSITSSSLSNMQPSSLLTDPIAPNHLLLGGDQGLFESRDDGRSWRQITDVAGNVLSLVASKTTPRRIFCVTDQGFYRWNDGSTQIVSLTNLPMGNSLTRLVSNPTGSILYGLAGQDLWYSTDAGTTWRQHWHFDRGDIISFIIDPQNPDLLYIGFLLPGKVMYSTDGGYSWKILTS